MEYKGKLYGKVAGEYFPLYKTADEVDAMEKQIEDRDRIIAEKDSQRAELTNSLIKRDEQISRLQEALRKCENEKNEIANNANIYIKKLEQRLHG